MKITIRGASDRTTRDLLRRVPKRWRRLETGRVSGRFAAFAAAITVSLLVRAIPTLAQAPVHWTGATSTEWHDGSNWDSVVPSESAVLDTVTPNPTVIDGRSASLTSSIQVGLENTGRLTMVNGGVLAVGSDADIGSARGASGDVTVSGSGSRLNVGGNMVVGGLGTGMLTLENGAQAVNTGVIHIGGDPGGQGQWS